MTARITTKSVLTALLKAAGKGDVREYLNGIHLGEEVMAATNGHVLAQAKYSVFGEEHPAEREGGMTPCIISREAVEGAIKNCTTNKHASVLDNTCAITSGGGWVNTTSVTRKLDKSIKSEVIKGTFPDIECILKALPDTLAEVAVNPEYLIAIGQAAKLTGAIKIKIKITGADSGVLFETPHLSGVIMPIRP